MTTTFAQLNKIKIKMEIVPQIRTIASRARRNHPKVEKGTLVYCIHYIGYEGYFTYSYLKRGDAEKSIQNMIDNKTDTKAYMDFNYAPNVDCTLTN